MSEVDIVSWLFKAKLESSILPQFKSNLTNSSQKKKTFINVTSSLNAFTRTYLLPSSRKQLRYQRHNTDRQHVISYLIIFCSQQIAKRRYDALLDDVDNLFFISGDSQVANRPYCFFLRLKIALQRKCMSGARDHRAGVATNTCLYRQADWCSD